MNDELVGRIFDELGQGDVRIFERMSPQGRALFLKECGTLVTDRAAFEALHAVDYDRIPPDIDTFLTSPDFMGGTGLKVYSGWPEVIKAACHPGTRVTECILTGAQGRGKTTAAMCMLAYKLVRLACMRDPSRFYELAPRTNIIFGLYMVTKRQLGDTGFYTLRDQIIDRMPFFQDVFPRIPYGQETIRWERGEKVFTVSTNSKAWHSLGTSLFAVAADELNYFDQGQGTLNVAREIVTEVSSRLESRFLDEYGDIPGIACFISQTRTESDFLEQRAQEKKDDPHVLVDRGPRWERGGPKPYRGITTELAKRNAQHPVDTVMGVAPGFRVYLGDETTDPRVLDRRPTRNEDGSWWVAPVDPTDEPPADKTLIVPINYWKRFHDDVYGALRLVADRPTSGFTPFFSRREVLSVAFDEKLINPVTIQTVRCYEGQNNFELADIFQWKRVTNVYMGRRAAIRHPDAPRYIHLDPAKGGKGRDWYGMAMVHPSRHFIQDTHYDDPELLDPAQVGQSLSVKDVEVDFYIRLTAGPRGQAVNFKAVRVYIDWLQRIGFWIRKVTADGWQCLAAGTLVSTDRGIIPIEDVREGDSVQARSGVRRVTKTWAFGRKDTLVLRTQHGDALEGTGRHRIEVLSGWDHGEEQRERKRLGSSGRIPVWAWKRFDEMRVGDVVRVWDQVTDLDAPPAVLDSPDTRGLGRGNGGSPSSIDSWKFPKVMTHELAEWLGIVWGDGSVNDDSVTVTVAWDEVDDACDAFERLFGVPFLPHEGREGSTVVGVSARWLVRWMRLNGIDKSTMDIPKPIMGSGKDIRAAFLRGLFATDGSVKGRDGQVSVSTVSYGLAQQVRSVLMMDWGLGSALTIRSHDRPGCYASEGEEHIISIRGSRALIAECIGFSYSRKSEKLAEHVGRSGRRIFTKITSIESGSAEVFDLAVEDDPSFLANGIVSHNSVETLQRLRDKGYDADTLSLDRNAKGYMLFRQVCNEGRIAIPYPQDATPARLGSVEAALRKTMLYQELAGLEYDADREKVDHRDRNPDGSQGSKDISDAIVGATYGCLLDGVSPGENPEKQSGNRALVEAHYGRFMNQSMVARYLPQE